MNSKIHLRKNSLNEYFKAISHSFRVYSLPGFTTAVLSVSNLSRQGIPATCRVGHCVFAARCYLPQKDYAIRRVILPAWQALGSSGRKKERIQAPAMRLHAIRQSTINRG